MITPWEHLPNAAHIDRIITDLRQNADIWKEAVNETWNESVDRSMIYSASKKAEDSISSSKDEIISQANASVKDQTWEEDKDDAWYIEMDQVWYSATRAILALVAWEKSADCLGMTLENMKLRVMFNDHTAILMMPAVLALQKLNGVV
jgi:hypothetical protein